MGKRLGELEIILIYTFELYFLGATRCDKQIPWNEDFLDPSVALYS